MGFEITKEKYAGSIKTISIGKGDKAINVGGQTSYPFYQFEGQMPNKPIIAMEIWDMKPADWSEVAIEPFKDVIDDPAAWAKKCVEEYGAKAIVLQLKSIDPNDKDASAEDACKVVQKVLGAIDVPLIVWGIASPAKDEEVLKHIAEKCQGANLIIGPVEEKNYKGIGAAAMGYGHHIISSSPIDVNLAKQVNILLENLGLNLDKVICDPTTGGLGYGLEYTYSVMERLNMAAMSQGDDKLQNPIINNLGNEIWKCKEAKQTAEEAPLLGDPEIRTILMEAVGAVSYLLAGSSILIIRHPEAVKLVYSFIDLITDGGSAVDVSGITKRLDDVEIDFGAISPDPDLTIAKEEKPAQGVQKSSPAEAKKPSEPKKAEKKAEPKPEPKDEKKAEPVIEAKPNKEDLKAKAEAKEKAEIEAQKKAEAEAKAKKEAEEQAKIEAQNKAEAKEKANIEAQKQAEKEEAQKRDKEELEIKAKRAAEREKMAVSRQVASVEVKKTPAQVQKTMLDKIVDNLNKMHKRAN